MPSVMDPISYLLRGNETALTAALSGEDDKEEDMPDKQTSDIGTLVSLVDRFDHFGDRPAAIRFTPDGSETWSYSRLNREVSRLAGGLSEAGVEEKEPLAVMAEPSPEWMVAGLAILRVGGVLVPIDSQMPDRDLTRVFEDSGVRRIFTTERVARRLKEIKGAQHLEVILLDAGAEQAKEAGYRDWKSLRADGLGSVRSLDDKDTAILFYTSGTTGPPKGVPLSHRNILFQIETIEKTGLVNKEDRMLLPLPLHHVYPLVCGMLTPLALGVAILFPHALTGEGITRALSEGKGSVILGVPRLYRALLEGVRGKLGGGVGTGLFNGALGLSRAGNRSHVPVGKPLFRPIRNKMGPKVRLLASGGSPLDPQLAENLEALGWPVAVGYGLTETSPLLTMKWPGEGRHESVGRPIEGVELKIDPSALPQSERKAQEEGKTKHQRGEVLARGPNVFSGYHNLPDKTKESLVDGWFRTGDLGYIDDEGYLYLGGRASSMIVLEGGENINPEELEAAYSECDEVAEIGILEDEGKLAALVAPDRAVLREESGERIRNIVYEALKKQATGLPSYKKLSHIEITRQSLPATRLGKIKRHILHERYRKAKEGEEEAKQAGAVPIEELSSEDRVLLEDPRARKLWDILARRFPDRRLAPESNLALDLGIDSLAWVELSLTFEERVGISITEELIGRVETVRDLLEETVSAERAEGAESREPLKNPEKVLSEKERRWATRRTATGICVAAALYGMLRTILKLRCQVEARGLENLPDKGPYILAPNHTSFIDAPVLAIASGYHRAKEYFWAGRQGILFRNMIRRRLSRACQVVPIDPKRGPISSLAVSAMVMKRRFPLVWFPEGRISKDGRLQEFQPGIGLIIDYYEPLVVPVFIEGTFEAMPLGKKFPRARKITVHFGKPIDAEKLKADARKLEEGEMHERITKVLHEAVKDLADSVRKGGPSRHEEEKARRAEEHTTYSG